MANETILVVDADPRSQKVLEVSFKKAGYRVVMTDSVQDALASLDEVAPYLIISETVLPDGDGLEFCADLKLDPRYRGIPFIFLTEDRSLTQKMRGFELGADDYLTKPVYIKEVTTRVELLMQKRAKELLSESDVEEFEGNLSDITMIDLLQTIEEELRSGSIRVSRNGRQAAVYFREGNVLDAICGKLQGEEALYRVMLWPEGYFVVHYHDHVRRADHIEKDARALLFEGIRRLDQWNELMATLPETSQVFEADYQRLPSLLGELPAEVERVMRLFDGYRTLGEVIDDSPIEDIKTLHIIRKLLEDDILLDVTPGEGVVAASSGASDLNDWLAGASPKDTAPGMPFVPLVGEFSEPVTGEIEDVEGDEGDGPEDEVVTFDLDRPHMHEVQEPAESGVEHSEAGDDAAVVEDAVVEDAVVEGAGDDAFTAVGREEPADERSEPREGDAVEVDAVEAEDNDDEDEVASEPVGGGHWKFHWDADVSGLDEESAAEAPESGREPEDSESAEAPAVEEPVVEEAVVEETAASPAVARLDELEERERRRREEEARRLSEQMRQVVPVVSAAPEPVAIERPVVLSPAGEPERSREPVSGGLGNEDSTPRLPGAREAADIEVEAVVAAEERAAGEHDARSPDSTQELFIRTEVARVRSRVSTPIATPAQATRSPGADADADWEMIEIEKPGATADAGAQEPIVVPIALKESLEEPFDAPDSGEPVSDAPAEAAGLSSAERRALAVAESESVTAEAAASVRQQTQPTPQPGELAAVVADAQPAEPSRVRRVTEPLAMPGVSRDEDDEDYDDFYRDEEVPTLDEVPEAPGERVTLQLGSVGRHEVEDADDEVSLDEVAADVDAGGDAPATAEAPAAGEVDEAAAAPSGDDDVAQGEEVAQADEPSGDDEPAQDAEEPRDDEVSQDDVAQDEEPGEEERLELELELEPFVLDGLGAMPFGPVDDAGADADEDDGFDLAVGERSTGAADASEALLSVERMSRDNEIVRAEYDLSRSGSRAEAAGIAGAVAPGSSLSDEPPASSSAVTEELPRGEDNVEAKADAPAEADARGEAAAKASVTSEAAEHAAGAAATTEPAAAPENAATSGGAESKSEDAFFARRADSYDDFSDLEDPAQSGNWKVPVLVVGGVALAAMLFFGGDALRKSPEPEARASAPIEAAAPEAVAEPAVPPVEEAPPAVVAGGDEGGAPTEAPVGAEAAVAADETEVAGEEPAAEEAVAEEPVAEEPVAEEPAEAVAEVVAQAPAAPVQPAEARQAEPRQAESRQAAAAPANDLNSQINELRNLIRRERISDALSLARELTAKAPNDRHVAFLHGQAALYDNRNSEAIEHLTRAERLGLKSGELYLELGSAYQIAGRNAQAKRAYETYLELNPRGRAADEVRSILQNQF